MRLWPLIPALAIPSIAGAELRLALPIACDPGGDCHIQQFVDRDPGAGATDFTCGPLTYDGHQGTDFALSTLADLTRDVAVLAAAPGVISGVRDGMADALQTGDGAPDVDGRECGNGVVIDHADGWQTQYCHMAAGSVRVVPGQSVTTGEPLGAVGLSGQTQFPHLHLTVRKDGEIVDPFDPGGDLTCGAPPTETLWAVRVPYAPGGLLSAGFANGIPEFEAIKAGLPEARLASDAPMVLWAHMFGGREGDLVRIDIAGPQGEVIALEEALTRTQAQLFRAAGRRAPAGGWPAGRYGGTVELVRDGTVIDTVRTSADLD